MPHLPLKDLRVVELASVLAGPAVGMFLAEQGATVLKIENKRQGGDITRFWKLPQEDPQAKVSAYFSAVNAGKTHLFLDLSDQEDLMQVHRHLEQADVLLMNFKPGDDHKFGFDRAAITQRYPQLIVGVIVGFESAPQRVAYDVVVQAETGYMSMNGLPETGPLKMPVALMDLLAAHQLKQGILLALYEREKTGKGAWVSCSLEAAGISNLANQASNFLMTGVVPRQMGSLHPNIAPYGDTFICADGKSIVLAVGSDGQFYKLLEVLGIAAYATDPRLRTNAARVQNRSILQDILKQAFELQQRDAVLQQLIDTDIPAGAVRTVDEVFQSPKGKSLIWATEIEGVATQRVRTSGFTIQYNDSNTPPFPPNHE
jgi:crotonobetainyl-CoA:carnitine CoA-transferase CaiB-like acyl-CoA transferase